MKEKINVGIIGATGMVGQYFITLLENHPWFTVSFVAASGRSAGKMYKEAVAGRWHMNQDIPADTGNLIVADAMDVCKTKGKCSLVFSAIKLDQQATMELENRYAAEDFIVVSNNSAHRGTSDVPVLIPEVNFHHLDIIPAQRKHYGFQKGLIVVKPNCSIQSYMTPVYALIKAGYTIDRLLVTTLQAISGAGHPGVSSLDIIDNTLPLPGEEIKSETEPMKIFGSVMGDHIEPDTSIKISAHCNRVPVIHGHIACVNIGFQGEKPTVQEIIHIWNSFSSLPQELGLPSAPVKPVIYRGEDDRPQPRIDRDTENGMTVTTGRLRDCPVFDYKFLGLHHNIIRGAAGGAVLIAELLKAKGFM
ncbi:MAG: aspartate-semialdehyde dehydrogenase [Spirochaetales bacterium]|nr:aspartate-semialdehyde dehydrogenase [Spirochaetales bacterium]